MKNFLVWRACRLAWRDYCHEALLSACSVLGLAAVLAPLLVLYGVKFGVVGTMTDRLKNDPRNLEVSPVSSGHFTPDDLAALAARPDVAFVLPRTRSIAATMELSPVEKKEDSFRQAVVSLEPTAPGDPLLTNYLDAPIPVTSASTASETSPSTEAFPVTPSTSFPVTLSATFPVTLSASAAGKLGVVAGDVLRGRVERLLDGKAQGARVTLKVNAVLPLEAQQKDVAFIPLSLLEATEDFRDGRRPAEDPRLAPAQGWTGEPRPAEPRVYPGFRLYARSLEDVATLRAYFDSRRVEVYTQAEAIAAVNSLDRSLSLIFGLIGTAAGLGFLASSASSSFASVRRKERHLGILRLVGYPASAIMAFPLVQGLVTGFLGTGLAVALYSGTALIIDQLFASSLRGVEHVCSLRPLHLLAALALVQTLTLLAAWRPAARAARIEPSEVIRDV